MFSPYYAWSGWRDPEHHCAVNVALYQARGNAWAMTERGRASVSRSEHAIAIGRNHARWDGAALHVRFDELTAPLPGRLRGNLVVRPHALFHDAYALDENGKHFWRPIAPRADVEVEIETPAQSWRGEAYLDCNWGSEPIDRGFQRWDWSRAHAGEHVIVHYDVVARNGAKRAAALRFDRTGDAQTHAAAEEMATLPASFWRVPRKTHRDETGAAPALIRTLEDTPFYTRSWLRGRYEGRDADIIHESLSADRLRSPIVRAMLIFRMPRIA